MTTRQLHSTENTNRSRRNAVDRVARAMTVSTTGALYTPLDIGTHATVIPIREFTPNVPFTLSGEFQDAIGLRDYQSNILGPVFEDNIPVVTSNDPASLLAAFNKRCNFVQANAQDDITDSCLADALAHIASLPDIYTADPWDENPVDRGVWLSKFDSAKRKRMEETWIQSAPEATNYTLGKKSLMVKIEVLLKRSDDAWAPRVIYVGSDEHNCVTGPAMNVAMQRLCGLMDASNEAIVLRGGSGVRVHYAYKKSDVKICQHLLSDPAFSYTIEGDYSANDREQRSRVSIIIDAWLQKLNMPLWLRDIMMTCSAQYAVMNREMGLRATIKHQMPTGGTQTTFRNSAFNTSQFCVSMMRQSIDAIGVILGDDLLARLRKPCCIPTWIKTVGDFKMILKAFARQIHGEATLLSRRLFADEDVSFMMPKFGKALARFNVRANKRGEVSDSQYMAGKALSYCYEFRHVPLIREYFMRRYEAEDHNHVTLDDLTWFTRTAGMDTPEQVMQAILNERVLASEDRTRDFFVETYSLGLVEVHWLCSTFILPGAPKAIATPLYDNLVIDL